MENIQSAIRFIIESIWDFVLYAFIALIAAQTAIQLGHQWWVGVNLFVIAYYLVTKIRSALPRERAEKYHISRFVDGSSMEVYYDDPPDR